jgi:hypothetical protein
VTILLSTGRLTHLEAALDFGIRGLRLARPVPAGRDVRGSRPMLDPRSARRNSVR